MLLREQVLFILGVVENERVSIWLSFRLAVSEYELMQKTQFNEMFLMFLFVLFLRHIYSHRNFYTDCAVVVVVDIDTRNTHGVIVTLPGRRERRSDFDRRWIDIGASAVLAWVT